MRIWSMTVEALVVSNIPVILIKHFGIIWLNIILFDPCSIDDTVDVLRAKLARAQETILQLQHTITNMEKRFLPSPDISDDEMSPIRRRRYVKHQNFSEEILPTNMY